MYCSSLCILVCLSDGEFLCVFCLLGILSVFAIMLWCSLCVSVGILVWFPVFLVWFMVAMCWVMCRYHSILPVVIASWALWYWLCVSNGIRCILFLLYVVSL